jgi:hypothetical protein
VNLSSAFGQAVIGQTAFCGAPRTGLFSMPPASRTLVVQEPGACLPGDPVTMAVGEVESWALDWTGILAGDPIFQSIWTISPSGPVAQAAQLVGSVSALLINAAGAMGDTLYVVTNTITTGSGLKLSASFKLVVWQYNFDASPSLN